MLNEHLRLHRHSGIDALIKIVIGAALLAVLSPLRFGGETIPITLQSMLVVFLPLVFGWRIGTASVVIYLLLGAAGLPVFADYSAGLDKFTGTSGGFLLAFPIAAVLIGFVSEQSYKYPSIMAFIFLVFGQMLILLLGLFWMQRITHESFDLVAQLQQFAPGLGIKSGIGAALFIVLQRVAGRTKQDA